MNGNDAAKLRYSGNDLENKSFSIDNKIIRVYNKNETNASIIDTTKLDKSRDNDGLKHINHYMIVKDIGRGA
jgi:hypothetical protein